MKLYHMTSKHVFDKIEESGYLEPRTYDPYHSYPFIVCGLNPEFSEWEEYGLLELLLTKISLNESEIYVIEFDFR